jgi:hypothetical protein
MNLTDNHKILMNIKFFFRRNNQYLNIDKKHRVFVPMLKYLFFAFVVFLLLIGWTNNKDAEIVLGNFSVDAGDYDRFDAPIRFECKLTDLFGENSNFRDLLKDHQFMLYEEGRRKSSFAAQWEPEANFDREGTNDQGTLIWILKGTTKKESILKFNLILKKRGVPESPFSIEDVKKKSLLIKNENKPVLQYNYGIMQEKEGETNLFDRSSYIHPVWTPTGKIITGDFSPEHIYQRGIFKAWRKVKFGDIKTEFWSIGLDSAGQTLKDNKEIEIVNGPVYLKIVVYNKGVFENKTFCKEICTIRIYNRQMQSTWMFDLLFREIPVDPEHPDALPGEKRTMELPQIYYGGLSFRGASPEWLRRGVVSNNKEILQKFAKDTQWLSPGDSLDILTSGGKTRKTGDGIPARWIDYTGPLGDEWGGLVVFDHPSNQRYPTPLRIHPDLPYFSYAFTKNDPYTITSEAPLNLMYRFVVHNGHPDKNANEKIASDFVDPPHVTWKPAK